MSSPARLGFGASPRSTVGIEWEIGLVESGSADLAQSAPQVLEALARDDAGRSADAAGGPAPQVTGEFMKNTIELVSGVCRTVGQAGADLERLLGRVRAVTDPLGLELMGGGTHPFARGADQQVGDTERYARIMDRTGIWGAQLIIWGLHVHVGVEHRDKALPLMRAMLTYFPHLQALSAGSPYWAGEHTGYASNRSLLFQQIPSSGLPVAFETWQELETYAADLQHVGAVEGFNEVHWDVRPSPALGTLEVRVCDGPTNLTEALRLAALVHCLVEHLSTLLDQGRDLPVLPPWFVQENKFRSARYGLDATVILDAEGNQGPVTDAIAKLLVELEPVAQRIGCATELAGIRDIVRTGASYQRQQAVAAAHDGDLTAVVRAMLREMREGRPLPSA
ncbi:glutamate--cysteine ligase [Promicromonospora thailandica]|uniref:Putative glutamate--cysteine ligase 2 n=1 Tax=Promicromonospora thailandica TaxID=765201 RepID=A0A9X2G0K1_9MICO|nr:glutamate--cysteine ligase [Promicromonospora thailandica]MCP2264832.1 carboxylate-amine ligase [Promicromonospora thailandica]BFF18913.1 glutamate--cysteine ligase [Promicromonospora thailandica]